MTKDVCLQANKRSRGNIICRVAHFIITYFEIKLSVSKRYLLFLLLDSYESNEFIYKLDFSINSRFKCSGQGVNAKVENESRKIHMFFFDN